MKEAMVRAEIDRKRCIGAGQCVSVAPAFFDQDDFGLVILIEDPPAAGERDVRQAVALCPAQAIRLLND
ncbi:ferredoxin [Nocardia sp. NPDC048505]|uniref:ferredoxin n=1 Tax=Nocardia sp. NPDC048505 TaxID=3155756 RepID=UPI0033C0CB7A